ncbi:Uncharacterized membrane protein YckC, RDD family [Halpernia humi]|uniref:Uncharacterized membrane protein YckC, RDD family n=1 Tax=Halpernia humi TaxID=493375 RepID=A0A1H5SQZ7_9FLAO|nr:RDD family protein [Halpernia humi]SEF52979.1 Uncharacterized membrane protein YckC, RDD family [Halpernia humi]
MAKLLKIVHDNKAEKGLRFLNLIIDYAFCYIILIIILGISAFLYSFLSGRDLREIGSILSNVNEYLDRFITFVAYLLSMFLLEYFTKGRSLGKFITGTMVVRTDGRNLTIKDYFLRNISRGIPFDAFSFLGNNGWHDSFTDTRVVKKKAYEEAQAQQADLDNLGKRN